MKTSHKVAWKVDVALVLALLIYLFNHH